MYKPRLESNGKPINDSHTPIKVDSVLQTLDNTSNLLAKLKVQWFYLTLNPKSY